MAIDRTKIQKQAESFVASGRIDRAIEEFLKLLEDRGRPSRVTVPPERRTIPMSAFMKVDFPAPLAPMTATISRSRRVRENPCSALIAP